MSGKREKRESTPKGRQLRFCEEYLVCRNASEAYRRAGYNPKHADVDGPRLLGKAGIQSWLKTRIDEVSKKAGLRAEEVIREVARLAFSDVTNYILTDDGRVELAEGAPADAMRAVQSIKREVFVGEDGDSRTKVELKLWDKPAALRLGGMHLGLWDEKTAQQGAQIFVIDPYAEIKK
jgi:phage terminase small subunit